MTKKILLGLAIAFSAYLGLATNVTKADIATINFESPSYSLGNIHNQDGWSKTGSFDVEIESNIYGIPSFGSQVLRYSNAVTSGSFGDQTFSKSLANEAGETTAQSSAFSGGTRQGSFVAQFDIASALEVQQPGLFLSVSPDRGDGARMGYVGFDDQSDGIHVIFYDYKDNAPVGSLATPANGCAVEDDFALTDVATISRGAHTIKLTMDLNDGPDNDVVKLYVDGVLEHTGGSWEDYFRWCTESGGGIPNDSSADVSRTIDSLLFRAGGSAAPATIGNGYLIDNLTLTSGAIVTPTPSPFAVPAQCVGNGTYGTPIVGTNQSEKINGTNGDDLIFGLDGSDKIDGKGGNDCIVGGDQSDKIIGGNGNDVLLGGAGSDSLEGNNNSDKLYGGDESDSLKGGSGSDELWGGNGSDSLKGEAGADTLNGEQGSDSLDGGDNNDILDGGTELDSAKGGNGNDTCTAESEKQCEV